MKPNIRIRFVLTILIIGCVLVACNDSKDESKSEKPTQLATNIMGMASNTPGEDNRPTGLIDHTPIEISSTPNRDVINAPKTLYPTGTVAIESEATETITPTISQKNAVEMFKYYLSGNGVCKPPCWWGITPGVSTWTDVKNQFSPLGTVDIDNRAVYFKGYAPRDMDRIVAPLPSDYVYGQIYAKFLLNRDIVSAIIINSRWVSENFDFSLSSLLQHFGKPDEIWIEIEPKTMGDSGPTYQIDIFYKGKGMIWINGKGIVEGSVFTFCPQKITSNNNYPPYLYLWGDTEKGDFLTSEILFQDNSQYRDFFQKISDLSSTPKNEAEFYDLYSKPGVNECVVIQMDGK